MKRFLCVIVAIFVLGCIRWATSTSGLPAIEALLAEHRVVQMAPGDPIRTGRPKIIQIYRHWSDETRKRDENEDGRPRYSFVSQVGMSVHSVGDWKAVTELISSSLESSETTAEQLFRHRDDRIRFATYYTLGQRSPIAEYFPNSSPQIVAELARIVSGGDVYEAALSIDLLNHSRVYSQEAFVAAIKHPCAQIRLAALTYLSGATLNDDERKKALTHLVARLDDRDTVVREAAYCGITDLVADWRRVADSGGKLPDGVAGLIETIPSSPENAIWYRDVSRPITELLHTNKSQWTAWLASHGL